MIDALEVKLGCGRRKEEVTAAAPSGSGINSPAIQRSGTTNQRADASLSVSQQIIA